MKEALNEGIMERLGGGDRWSDWVEVEISIGDIDWFKRPWGQESDADLH